MLPILRVSDNHRYLMMEEGQPFFYLGDTAWEIFHRQTLEEVQIYFEDRVRKGFTVIQAVALAEFDGLHTPNANGDVPLIDDDPTKPNEPYFRHMDAMIDAAARLGLRIGLLPTWGDKWNEKWGPGPEIFTPENAEVYGEFIGRRYRDTSLIWILGGDRNPENDTHMEIVRAMAAGIKRGDGGRNLMTLHPGGQHRSAEWFHQDDWLDFNMDQSGHHMVNTPNYEMIAADYAMTPAKPCIDGEPCYEDHAVNWNPENGWFNDYDARKAAYWAVFAGAMGHTYGCHDIWQMWETYREPVHSVRRVWREALSLPGAVHMTHVRALMESRPFFTRIPDQSLVVSEIDTGAQHVQATRDANGSYAMIYIPTASQTVAIDTSRLSAKQLNAWWYDPRTGTAKALDGDFASGTLEFTTPENGPDWVLVLDDATNAVPPPGVVKV